MRNTIERESPRVNTEPKEVWLQELRGFERGEILVYFGDTPRKLQERHLPPGNYKFYYGRLTLRPNENIWVYLPTGIMRQYAPITIVYERVED